MENQVDELDKKIDDVHATLSNTSVELNDLFWKVPRDHLLWTKPEFEWNALQILIHLRQISILFAERVKRIMSRENPEELVEMKDFDEYELMAKVHLDQELAKSNINEFMHARSEMLNLISLIDKEEWKKKVAKHEKQGDLSLLELLTPEAEREIKYLKQLKSLLEFDENVEELEMNPQMPSPVEVTPRKEYSVDDVHATLTNTSVVLSDIFWDSPREAQLKRPNSSGWSALEILIHMRQVSEVFAERVKRAMHRENNELIQLHDYDEKKQMSKVNLNEETARGNLTEFMNSRSELLNEVSLIDKEIWNVKVAKHDIQGELSLLELLGPLADRETHYLEKLKILLADYV